MFTYVTDHLGTPKELVDDRERVAWAVAHSAWGKVEQVLRDPAATIRPADFCPTQALEWRLPAKKRAGAEGWER